MDTSVSELYKDDEESTIKTYKTSNNNIESDIQNNIIGY